MHHHLKKREFIFTKVDKLATITSISALSTAIVSTIWAIYLNSFLNNESYVGFLTAMLTVTAIISTIVLIPFVEKNSKSKIYLVSLAIYTLSYILFAVTSSIFLIIGVALLISVIGTLKVTVFGIILRDKSKDKNVSKNIGLVYTFVNLSWLIGPLIAGFIAQDYGIAKVFFVGAGFQALAFFLFISFRIKDDRVEKRIDRHPLRILTDFLKNKNRLIIYILSSGVNFWWALIYIYIPMHIIDSGFNDRTVGYFLFAVIVPLVLLEYYFGKKASEKGFKRLFFTGYFLLSLFSLICFFVGNLYFILIILVLASVSAAMVEPTTEAYFFMIISEAQRDKFYSPYNTAIDIANAVATFLGAVILFFLPFKFIFIFFAISMFSLAMLSLRVREVVKKKSG